MLFVGMKLCLGVWLRIGGFEYEWVVSSCVLGVTGRQAMKKGVVSSELSEDLHGCSCFLVDTG